MHESGATRALLSELLSKEQLQVEAADSTYDAIARFIDAPVELVLLGLGDLGESEIDVIATLKAEPEPPRVIVSFPSPRRDLAVRALNLGADGYILEPFYSDELIGIVRGQLAPRGAARPSAPLTRLAREVAHGINNPLQVLTLLLEKDKVTKKQLMDTVPGQVGRIEQVVKLLRDFGAIEPAVVTEADPQPGFTHACEDASVEGEVEEPPPLAIIDPQAYADALDALFAAARLRCGADARLSARLVVEKESVAVRLATPAAPFAETGASALLDAVFTVEPQRDVLPGLARARALLENMGGSLNVQPQKERLVFVARVPRVSAA